MYCIRCGNQLKDGTKYCIFCGAPTADVKKQTSGLTEENTVSIPVDFFSSRMAQEGEDDFTIAIPDHFAQTDAVPLAEQPDDIEDIDFTRMVAKEDIRKAIEEQMQEDMAVPDEVEDEDFTRMVAKEEIREAMEEQNRARDIEDTCAAEEDVCETMEEQNRAGDMEDTCIVEDIHEMTQEQEGGADNQDDTRVVPKETVDAAKQEQEETPPVDVSEIPDIAIPADFIADGSAADDETQRSDVDEEQQDAPEQLISRRGMLFVVGVVVLLFAIAVGACIAVLRGDTAPATDTGSGSAEVGFWSASDGE